MIPSCVGWAVCEGPEDVAERDQRVVLDGLVDGQCRRAPVRSCRAWRRKHCSAAAQKEASHGRRPGRILPSVDVCLFGDTHVLSTSRSMAKFRRQIRADCHVRGSGAHPAARGRRTATVAVSAHSVAVAAVAGAWLSHTLEYGRVWGWSEFGSAASRQVHTYMGPVGLLLLALAVIGVEAGLRTVRRLNRVLSGLSDGSMDPADAHIARRRFALPATTLLALEWVLQVALYVVQENVEHRAIGVHQPVLSVLTGVHQWAAGIHLVVAILLVVALWLLHRPLAELAQSVRDVVRWLLAAGRPPVLPTSPPPPARSWTPTERFGRQLWSRPPPVLFTV